MTKYVILGKTAVDKTWSEEATGVEASSTKAAISAHMKKNDLDAGTFIAVPERSWKPETPTVKQHFSFS